MKTDNITHRALPLSTLNYGEIFSLDGELYMKINLRNEHCVDIWGVALRNGNLVPFSADPIVVWEDASITRRKGKRTKYDKYDAPEIRPSTDRNKTYKPA